MQLCADYGQMILEPKIVYGIDLVDNFQGDGSQVNRLEREDARVSGDGRSGISVCWRTISLQHACFHVLSARVMHKTEEWSPWSSTAQPEQVACRSTCNKID
jgi:hypothetical protein